MSLQYDADYNLQEKDNIIELIARLRVDLYKEIYESIGYGLNKTNNQINYKNYLINNPQMFGNQFGLDIGSFENYTGGVISLDELMKIYPRAKRDYAGAALAALDKYGSTVGLTDKGKLMVLAQFAHESGNFIYTAELGKGKGRQYGQPSGPYGKIYYGRGPIQITWETNYKTITQNIFPKMGINADIWADPDLCEQNLLIGCAASLAWFLLPGNGKRAIAAANAGDVLALTKAINGGTNGLDDRKKNTEKIFAAVNKK